MRKKLFEQEKGTRQATWVTEASARPVKQDFSDPRSAMKALTKHSLPTIEKTSERRGVSVVRAPELKPVINHADFFGRAKSPLTKAPKRSLACTLDGPGRLDSSRHLKNLPGSKELERETPIASRSRSVLKRVLNSSGESLRPKFKSLRDSINVRPKIVLPLDEKLSTLLRHRFSIMKVLGQGAYSTIYLANSLEVPGHRVALKVMRNDKKSAANEFEILRSLDHECIIRAEELILDEQTNQAVIVLELAGERTLSDVQTLIEGQVFPEARAILFFTQLARALQHMHSLNLVHSDLKTENISLVDENKVKLIDFGFSRDASEAAPLCGTLGYMSPQQIRRLPFCPFKAEVWSLGVVLYKLLFNLYPIKAKTLEEASQKVKGFKLVLPASRKLSLPTRQLLSRLLAPEEAKRPSLEELQTEFSFLFL